jgi:hypothetical protein
MFMTSTCGVSHFHTAFELCETVRMGSHTTVREKAGFVTTFTLVTSSSKGTARFPAFRVFRFEGPSVEAYTKNRTNIPHYVANITP